MSQNFFQNAGALHLTSNHHENHSKVTDNEDCFQIEVEIEFLYLFLKCRIYDQLIK